MEEMEYSINATKEGYMINKESAKISTVGLGESQSFIVEIELVHIEEELRAPEVRYPLNQWTFINDETCMSKDSLLFLSDLLSSHPYITIDLFSHTDSRSSAKYNQVLSENRAKAVYKFLVEEKGIDPRRIQPVGMGEADPATWIDENGAEIVLTESYINKFRSTDKAKFEKLHQINRRTTARITSQEFDSNTAPVANPEWMEFKPLR
jgi:outer membrane protein OmpA-like peptidoglycan-associated protein